MLKLSYLFIVSEMPASVCYNHFHSVCRNNTLFYTFSMVIEY